MQIAAAYGTKGSIKHGEWVACVAIYIGQLRGSVVVEKESVCRSVMGLRRFRISVGHAAHIESCGTMWIKFGRIVKLVTAGTVVMFVHCGFWCGFLNSLNIAVGHIYKSIIEYINNYKMWSIKFDMWYFFIIL